ncbi:hypothetical protein BDW72DRAFT_167913 [Aspergillus terricola var. indicus]
MARGRLPSWLLRAALLDTFPSGGFGEGSALFWLSRSLSYPILLRTFFGRERVSYPYSQPVTSLNDNRDGNAP